MEREVVVCTASGPYGQLATVGEHHFLLDEPVPESLDQGPKPTEALLAALGACTSMTLQMYARRKGWVLDRCEVHLRLGNDSDGVRILRQIRIEGALDDDQRARLMEIADKCPVHKLVTLPTRVVTERLERPSEGLIGQSNGKPA